MRGCGKLWLSWVAAGLLCALLAAAAWAQGAPASGAMIALQRAHWIPLGSRHPQHVLYVFMDANCPYCHRLWRELQPYYGSGLQVRALLVGVISASSPGKAAAIFAAPDPAAALRENEAHWGRGPDPRGGIAPLAHPSAQALRMLEHNEALMEAFQLPGTPGIVFADGAGKVYVLDGVPAKADLPRIIDTAGVPSQAAGSTSPR